VGLMGTIAIVLLIAVRDGRRIFWAGPRGGPASRNWRCGPRSALDGCRSRRELLMEKASRSPRGRCARDWRSLYGAVAWSFSQPLRRSFPRLHEISIDPVDDSFHVRGFAVSLESFLGLVPGDQSMPVQGLNFRAGAAVGGRSREPKQGTSSRA